MQTGTMERLQEVTHLNATGVQALIKGDGGNALRAFKGALAIMDRVAQDPSYDDDLFENTEQFCISQPIVGLQECNHGNVSNDNVNNTFFLYGKAIVFHASAKMDIRFANAALLFNLALTFHQGGLMASSRMGHQQAKLQKAVSLYNLSIQVIQDDAAHASPAASAIFMAALNNSAHIQYEMCDYEASTATLKMLEWEAYQQVSSVVQEQQQPSYCSSKLLENEDMDQLLLNVVCVKRPSTAASAWARSIDMNWTKQTSKQELQYHWFWSEPTLHVILGWSFATEYGRSSYTAMHTYECTIINEAIWFS